MKLLLDEVDADGALARLLLPDVPVLLDTSFEILAKALLRRYKGSIKALLKLYQGNIKALSRFYYGAIEVPADDIMARFFLFGTPSGDERQRVGRAFCPFTKNAKIFSFLLLPFRP